MKKNVDTAKSNLFFSHETSEVSSLDWRGKEKGDWSDTKTKYNWESKAMSSFLVWLNCRPRSVCEYLHTTSHTVLSLARWGGVEGGGRSWSCLIHTILCTHFWSEKECHHLHTVLIVDTFSLVCHHYPPPLNGEFSFICVWFYNCNWDVDEQILSLNSLINGKGKEHGII